MESTTELAILVAAHAVRDVANALGCRGREAFGAVERAAKAWEKLAEAQLAERAEATKAEVKP